MRGRNESEALMEISKVTTRFVPKGGLEIILLVILETISMHTLRQSQAR